MAAPKEINVRWNQGRGESLSSDGNVIAIDGKIVVGEDIAVGSTMWLGKIIDYVVTDTKMIVTDYSEVRDLKGRNIRRTVTVQRQSNIEASSV